METASLDWDVDPGEGTSHQPVSDHGHTGFCGDETAILTRRCNVLVFSCMIPYGRTSALSCIDIGRPFLRFFLQGMAQAQVTNSSGNRHERLSL